MMVSLASCSSSEVGGPVKIAYQKIPNSLALTKATNQLENLGYEVEWLEFASGSEVNTAFASGSVDIGIVGSNPFAVGISMGLDYQLILIHEILGASEALVSSVGAENLNELEGETIATPFASTAHYSLLKAIELEGKEESDFEIVDMQPGDILAAWQGGSLSNAYVWDPVLSRLKGMDGKVVVDSEAIAKAGYQTSNLGVVSSEFAIENPEFVRDYVSIQLESNDLLQGRDEGSIELLAEEFEVDQSDIEVQISGMNFPGVGAQTSGTSFSVNSSIYSSLEFLVQQGVITSIPSDNEVELRLNSSFVDR